MYAAAVAILGAVSCFFGSLVGFGGGFIAVPVLRFVGQLSPSTVAATSLFMVGVNVTVASVALFRQKRVNARIGWALGVGGIVGSLAGVFALRYVNATVFDVLYGLMLLFIAYMMLKPASSVSMEGEGLESERSARAGRSELAAMGVAVGFVSTLFGIGAGTISIPLLMWRYRIPAYIAMPTSSFVALVYIWPGIIAQGVAGRIDWTLAIPLSIGAIIGAQLGAQYSAKLRSVQLQRVFGAVAICAFVGLTARHLVH